MMTALDFIEEELKAIDELGLRRTVAAIQGAQGPRVRIGGSEKILLCSNNYLGLAGRIEIVEAAERALEALGTGSGASRLVCGTMEPHMELEERLARFKGAEAALLFNSGYHANTGVIPILSGRDAEIFSDRLNHASIVDGCILSRAKVHRYRHCDMDSLEGMLKRSRAARKLIVTEGVFSMDGDTAPLHDIVYLADRYRAILYIDDAHGTGVLGRNGRGTAELFDIKDPSVVQMGTLGKAFGVFGAFVTGPKRLIEFLINRARTFIYTTALPPALCAASIKAIEIVESEPALRKRLFHNIGYFARGLKEAGLLHGDWSTPIIPLRIGPSERTMEAAGELFERGVFIQGIRPPTVPKGTSRLRITLTSLHSTEDLDTALSALGEVLGNG